MLSFIHCKLLFWATVFFLGGLSSKAQGLYDLNTLQKIEITLTQPDWDFQMDTAKYGSEGYLMAAEVKINGTSYDSVGVKYKGNSSFDSTRIKNPLHIELDAFKNQDHQGFTDIKLSNGYQDPSMIREVLAYKILGNYMHCPMANFAQVYVNGVYWGLYSSAENIDKKFCANHFYSSQGTFIKCNPIVNPGPTTKSNLRFLDADSNSYNLLYEIKSKFGWNELVKLCDSVSNQPQSIERLMNLDRIIWMLAFNNALINLDSYAGVFAQNHYIYRDNNQQFNPIIWDLNMAFGGFPFAGNGATSMGSLSIANMQQFPVNNHSTDIYWPLIKAVQENPSWKRRYLAHLKTIVEEQIASGQYLLFANQLQSFVDTAVQSDTYKFFTHTQFQHAIDSLTDVGSYDVPGIGMLMQARLSYLQSLPEFTALAPTIVSLQPDVPVPAYGSLVTLRAHVNNASSNGVSLGYRFDVRNAFTRITMYDDGAHNDGAANDQVYGATIQMNGGVMQYYVYAENSDAGIFSPVRAEHEFHTLSAAASIPVAGQLVINELLADNVDNERDEYNDTEDWIEIYNNSNFLLQLDDVYLSDNASNLQKWKFPAGTTLAPSAYLVVWADDDANQLIYHSNFSLSKDSGRVFLSAGTGNLLDSVQYNAQLTNVSFGRYPNGSGSFVSMNTTWGAMNNNYPLGAATLQSAQVGRLFPNPAHDMVQFTANQNDLLQVFRSDGYCILRKHLPHTGTHSINLHAWLPGYYVLQIGNTYQVLVVY